jgi:hypothetical protein
MSGDMEFKPKKGAECMGSLLEKQKLSQMVSLHRPDLPSKPCWPVW